MELNLTNIASLFYFFAASILIVFLLSSKTENRLSTLMLSFYLILAIQDNGSDFTITYVYSWSPIIGMQISLTAFLLFPLFYLFIKSSVYRDFKLNWTTLLHLLPMVILNLAIIKIYYIPLLQNPGTTLDELISSSRFINLIYITLHVQMYTYYFFIFRMLFRYKILLQENYASPKLDNYKWLFQLTSILFIADTIATLKNVFMFGDNLMLYNFFSTMVKIIAVSIIFWLVIKALKKPSAFIGIKTDMQLASNLAKTDDNANSPEIIRKVENHMQSNEPYMDSTLSVYDLARQINVSSRELSVAINHHLDKHFFDYVNEYRIKKAMEIFKQTTDDKLTILEVLYEVGFNSKSSFNTAFRKFTGKTPSEYRKSA